MKSSEFPGIENEGASILQQNPVLPVRYPFKFFYSHTRLQISLSGEAAVSMSAEPAAKPSNESADTRKTTALIALNKKLISNSLNVIFSVLEEADNKGLASEVSSYIMVSIYKMLRAVYSANPKNPQAMFSILPELYSGLSSALQSIMEANAICISSGKNADGFDGIDISSAPQLSPDIISKKYPELAPALYNLIRETEEKIKKLT